jgi:hypothetical protein
MGAEFWDGKLAIGGAYLQDDKPDPGHSLILLPEVRRGLSSHASPGSSAFQELQMSGLQN